MSHFKRALAVLMALLMVLSCGVMASAEEEMVTLTTCKSISDTLQGYIDKKNDVLTDNIWFNAYRDLLGVDVQYEWTVPDTQYNEKLSAQIAANDLPDFFNVNASQLKQLVDYGMAMDLTDLFYNNASEFTMSMMEADMYQSLGQATFDGKLYAIPVSGGSRDSAAFWWIRKDWLDKLNLEIPTTVDELVNVMYAFTNDDPDGNGEADTYGMAMTKDLFGTNGMEALAEGFGAYTDGWVEMDGEKQYGSIQPQVKKTLELLNKLYADGVIDREFIVKDGSKVGEDISAGRIGLVSGQHWMAFTSMNRTHQANPEAEWIAISIVSEDGSKPKTMLDGSAWSYYVINPDCQHPEKVIDMYNFFFKVEVAVSPDYDPAYHGRLDADPNSEITQYYKWAAITASYPMQNLYIHMGVEKHYNGDDSEMHNGWITDNVSGIDRYLAGDETYYSTYIWSGPGEFTGEGRIHYYEENDMFLFNAYTGADTDSMTMFNATLDQLRLEMFTKIIVGEEPVDAFDTYVEQWKAMGGDMITMEVNAR